MIIEALFGIITYAAFHLGHHRGLVGAAFGFFGWLLAFIFAVKLTPWGTGVINSLVNAELQVNPLIAFVILGFIGWRIVQSISNSSSGMVENGEISVFNRLAGGALYWVAFMLTFSLVLRAGTTYKIIPANIVERSRIYNQMLSRYPDIAMKSLTYLIPFIADGWGVLDKAISDIDHSLNEARPAKVEPVVEPPPPPPQNTPNAPPTNDPAPNATPDLNSVFDKKDQQSPRRFREAE
jgi:uncharacterized membrane protein required for colicin V production